MSDNGTSWTELTDDQVHLVAGHMNLIAPFLKDAYTVHMAAVRTKHELRGKLLTLKIEIAAVEEAAEAAERDEGAAADFLRQVFEHYRYEAERARLPSSEDASQ